MSYRLSWAIARSPGERSLAWAELASFFRCGLPRPLNGQNTTSESPTYPLSPRPISPAALVRSATFQTRAAQVSCTEPGSDQEVHSGSHQPQWLDAFHRHHAVVEDRVRCDKAMGLSNLPSASWKVNRSWVLAVNITHDLDAWLRLLTLHDVEGLQVVAPMTMRYRLYHLPGKLTRHARYRVLAIQRTWPWAQAFTTCWQRLTALPTLT